MYLSPPPSQWNFGYKLNILKHTDFRISLLCTYETHLDITLKIMALHVKIPLKTIRNNFIGYFVNSTKQYMKAVLFKKWEGKHLQNHRSIAHKRWSSLTIHTSNSFHRPKAPIINHMNPFISFIASYYTKYTLTSFLLFT